MAAIRENYAILTNAKLLNCRKSAAAQFYDRQQPHLKQHAAVELPQRG